MLGNILRAEIRKAFQKKKRLPGNKWRLDETYLRVKGQWKYYCAVGKHGNAVDFLLTAKRDKKAAQHFFAKTVKHNGKPCLLNIDKSGANKSNIRQFSQGNNERVKICQCKYLNDVIEQDHRRITRLSRSMLGFKNFHCTQKTLAEIEVAVMIKKGQMKKTIANGL